MSNPTLTPTTTFPGTEFAAYRDRDGTAVAFSTTREGAERLAAWWLTTYGETSTVKDTRLLG